MGDMVPRPSPPDIDGYLDKLKHRQSIFGSWTRRYFRVNKDKETLEYFQSKAAATSGKNASKSISLLNLKSVEKFEEWTFRVNASSDGVYMLRAQSQAEYTCWFTALDGYIEEKNDWIVRSNSNKC